ncbi:MAG: ATP-dependent DNA helicase RuvA [Cryomorphaceae bacterium BACL11 MAG-121001-bin54]|nr:MAG: ATP-dependent DNA helicase RuvA [Cryomorphaceae bacterium BACL11 MAG-121001-bin54]KRO64111.1 MAG: ATP-dependent DNA helicase RuvA [Cryomorphaceae bacterium BACL11 MAG-121015-bin20]
MITHIHGKLVEKTPTYVVVDVNGIGYKIKISLQTFSAIDGEFCKLYTHLSVKEDSHTLFGFFEESERHLFRNLISVSGVGPSTAQVILSTYSPDEIIHHITTADVKAIESIKGIGGKTAQRIIIDLKDKVAKGMPTSDLLFDKIDNTIREEALSALLALGFAKKAAESKIDKVLKSTPKIASVEELVKTSLSQI